jgi:predicted transposase YdaD
LELLGEDPTSIASYQFTSVEVKEKAFRFDGVFLPQREDKTILIGMNQQDILSG